MRFLAFRLPFFGNLLMSLVRVMLWVFEFFRVRSLWRRTLDGLMAYQYWRGASQILDYPAGYEKFFTEYQVFVKAKPALIPMNLDLARGLLEAETLLDQSRPSSAVVTYGARVIGFIPNKPGTETLKGIHLRGILASDLSEEMRFFISSSCPLDAIPQPASKDR
jgi:hypothetical protein